MRPLSLALLLALNASGLGAAPPPMPALVSPPPASTTGAAPPAEILVKIQAGWECTQTGDGTWDCRTTGAVGGEPDESVSAGATPAVAAMAPPPEIPATPAAVEAPSEPAKATDAQIPPPSASTPLPPPGTPTAPAVATPRPPPPAPAATGPTPLPIAGPMEVPQPPSLPLIPAPSADAILPLAPPLVDLDRQVLTGESPWVLPPREPATPGTTTPGMDAALGPLPTPGHRDRELVLHQGLTWDYCGPRSGGTGLGGIQAPDSEPGTPVDATADHAEYDRTNEVVTLKGGVEFTQGDQRLTADRSTYQRLSGAVDASGDVFVQYPGARLTADSARYNLQSKEGTLDNVQYRLAGNANLRGSAAQAELLPEDRTHYLDVIYTTCPPGRSDWSIHAADLLLDHADGMGTARDARLQFGDLPVMYVPWLRFPIDDRRRSGLLIPTIGSSEANGVDITIPYYWNIAPNYDATFFPRYMSNRGLMLGAQFRHLAAFQTLEINGDVLPHDAESDEDGARGALRLEQSGQLGPRWSTSVDYSAVSDDSYLDDFGNRLDVTSIRNLTQRGDLYHFGQGFSALARVQDFQTVDPTIPAENTPYAQMPHMEFHLVPRRQLGPLDYDFEAHYDYFDHAAKVHGSRVLALPSIRWPLRRSFGSLVPRARLFYTGYELIDQDEAVAAHQSHLIPSLDLDGRLIFERDTDWFGRQVLQTLEPRLYYVLTPYENQTETPLFDTTELDFSFASLFRPNRFTGFDRVGDENRLTLALTSRTLAMADGRELFRASIGQMQYFETRQVQLAGDGLDEDPTSSVAAELAASLSPHWSARATLQWNPHEPETPWEKRVLQLRYAPDAERILNLAYRYNLGSIEEERYEDTDLSFRLPVTPKVELVGRWLYSLLNAETMDAFAGIEFGRCCWRLRVLGRHLKTASNDAGNTSIMLQLELAGLGALGNSIDKLLEQGIYGYGSTQ